MCVIYLSFYIKYANSKFCYILPPFSLFQIYNVFSCDAETDPMEIWPDQNDESMRYKCYNMRNVYSIKIK